MCQTQDCQTGLSNGEMGPYGAEQARWLPAGAIHKMPGFLIEAKPHHRDLGRPHASLG